jgi:lysophospholipase L1-like esterase
MALAIFQPGSRKLLALALLALGGAAQSQQVLNFVSAPKVGELQCPGQTPSPAAAVATGRASAPAGNRAPSIRELGTLARTVIRAQPAIDPRTIPGLALQNLQPPRRIAIWGDSHVAAGPLAPTLLQALRASGVSVGARFLPPTMGRANIRLPQLRAACAGPGWDTEPSYAWPSLAFSGPALAQRSAQAGPDSYLWLDLRDAAGRAALNQVRIVYRAPGGGALDIAVNDGPSQRALLPASSDGATQTLTLHGDAPVATVKLQVSEGRVLLYGFILDASIPPALTVDVFGLPSATVRGWANADPVYLRQALHGVNYDGVILEYGTNEGNAVDFDRRQYAALLTEALTRMRRVFPAASCLLVGPPDRGVLPPARGWWSRPDLLKFARTHQQIEATQREVGRRFDCAIWSWQDLMGGPGGSYGWYYAAPPLMGQDLTHLSAAGYQQTGQALARSLGWSVR